MLTRPIPQSDAPLPVVGIGTWQTFDIAQTPAEMDQRKEVLRVLFDAGGTVVDFVPDVWTRRSRRRRPAR